MGALRDFYFARHYNFAPKGRAELPLQRGPDAQLVGFFFVVSETQA
jgi:hypothetical protein